MIEPITAPVDLRCPICRELIRAGVDLMVRLAPSPDAPWIHFEGCATDSLNDR